MKRLLVAALVCAAAGVARADGTSTVLLEEVGVSVKVPDAWPYIPELTDGVVDSFKNGVSFGVAKYTAGGKAYADPEAGVGLYVLWAMTTEPVQYPEPVIRGEIDAMTERARHASLNEGETEIVAWKEELAAKTAGGRLEYRQLVSQTRTFARTLLFVDGKQRIHEARVECVTREDATAANRAACEAALASLTMKLADGDVASLGQIPASIPPGSATPAQPAAADAGVTAAPAAPGKPAGLPPMPAAAPKDRHTSKLFLVGGGALVLLAAAMFLTRRRRAG